MLLKDLFEYSVELDDTDSPDQAALKAKQQAMQQKQSPDRASRTFQQSLGDEEKRLAATKDSPIKQIDVQILRLKQQIAQLQMRKAQLQKVPQR